MPEIFGRTPLAFGGGFAADAANILFGAFSCPAGINNCSDNQMPPGAGLLTQNINFQYMQPITRLFEIGGNYSYYVAGRPQGNAAIGRILGPRPVTVAFYTIFGNVCTGPYTMLIFRAIEGCSTKLPIGTAGFYFGLNGALLQSIGVSVQANDMIVNEQLSFMFISLLIPDKNGVLSTDDGTAFAPTPTAKNSIANTNNPTTNSVQAFSGDIFGSAGTTVGTAAAGNPSIGGGAAEKLTINNTALNVNDIPITP